MRPFLEAGLTKEWLHSRGHGAVAVFSDVDERAYDYLLDHWAKHQVVPPLEQFQLNYPARVLRLPEKLLPDSELIEFAAETAVEVVDLHDDDQIDLAVQRIGEAARRLDAGLREPTGAIFNLGDP